MTIQKPFINIALMYLLIFVSGSMRHNASSNMYLVIGFLTALMAWYFFSDRKISEKFVLYCLVFIGLLFSLSLYTGGSTSAQAVISATMRLLLAYLIVRTIGEGFIDAYIKVVVFLAAISLFGYLTDMLHLFEGLVTRLPQVGRFGYEGVLYLFRHAFHPYRNNSIFFEPGAYQGFLNAALFLIAFAKTEIENRKKLVYSIVLLVALVTTFSTTGFVIFSVGFILFLFKSNIVSFYGKTVLVALIFAVVGSLSAQFHSTFVLKLSEYMDPSESRRGYSAAGRSFGAQTDLKLFRENVFGMGFDDYKAGFNALAVTIGRQREGGQSLTGHTGSGNGVTNNLAMNGLPYTLFLFGSYYWACRKLLGDYVLATVAFLMLVMFLVGEGIIQDHQLFMP